MNITPEPMKYARRYTVRGKGSFPHDMLRYDRSEPATPEDSQWIEIADDRSHREPVELMLIRKSTTRYPLTHCPTVGRWNSFGWEVTETFPIEKLPQEAVK